MIRRAIVVTAIRITVGINPKNRPEMEIITDLVSKTIPGTQFQVVYIITIPIPLNTKPIMILVSKLLFFSSLIQIFSYNIANASNMEVFCNNAIIMEFFMSKNFKPKNRINRIAKLIIFYE